MKRCVILFILILGCQYSFLHAQLSIDKCQIEARKNYPLIKRYDLIEKSKEYNLSNVGKGYLPQLQINAKATYQSEVTSIPISMPGIDIPTLKKDQYQAYIEATQTVWDGGVIHSQKKITEATSDVEKQQLNVDIYTLESRINDLFFGVLLFDAQLKQNRILQDELQRNYGTISSYIQFGIANQADLDAVKVEQLDAIQTRTQIQSSRQAYIDMLSYMTGLSISSNTVFIKPDANKLLDSMVLFSHVINRPEMDLFSSQERLYNTQKNMIKTSYMPKLNLFAQGGIGRPGLNMLSSDFDTYFTGGIRLSWNFGALYTQKNDVRKIEVSQNSLAAERETFLYNLNLEMTRENQDIKRLKELMEYDDEIISLRENIKKSAEAKVANGTLTVTDLMREISSENLARQSKASHEIELLIALYSLKNTTNN